MRSSQKCSQLKPVKKLRVSGNVNIDGAFLEKILRMGVKTC